MRSLLDGVGLTSVPVPTVQEKRPTVVPPWQLVASRPGREGGADLVDLGTVDADGFVEDLGSDAELVGPVGHVGGDLRVDLLGVMGAGGVVFVCGVGFVDFGCVVVLGHREASCTA